MYPLYAIVETTFSGFMKFKWTVNLLKSFNVDAWPMWIQSSNP